jgi:hypothetical protein
MKVDDRMRAILNAQGLSEYRGDTGLVPNDNYAKQQ